MAGGNNLKRVLAALLAVLAGAVYLQSAGFEFITLDDLNYTVYNPVVSGGFTLSGLKGAFSLEPFHAFVPVTQLSYMIDSALFGMKPWGFHLTNDLLHVLNTLLLFAFLHRATGSTVKSFFASALWALHPLRAESVAWVAERGDLLAGFFFLLGILAWREYARRKSPLFYALALLFVIVGGAAKPVLVTAPFLLLVLDFWPLERFGKEKTKILVAEKIPFLAVSAVYSAITLATHGISTYSLAERGISARLGDVSAAYGHYLVKTFWPVGLYMEDRYTAPNPSLALAVVSGVFAVAATAFLWRARKRIPAVSAGWAWYLAALFPVSGVVSLDFYYVADHFTYLPHVGLVTALVWGGEALFSRFSVNRKAQAAAGGLIIALLSILSFRQVSVWKNDYTLFTHVDRMSGEKSAVAKESIGFALYRSGNFQGAYDNFTRALELNPYLIGGHGNKALAAAKLRKYGEAVELSKKELRLNPGNRELSSRLANILLLAGDPPGAARLALDNLRIWPGDAESLDVLRRLGGAAGANLVLGLDLVAKDRVREAAAHFREAVRLSPGDYRARFNLGSALKNLGDEEGAKREYAEARRIDPFASYPEGVFLD